MATTIFLIHAIKNNASCLSRYMAMTKMLIKMHAWNWGQARGLRDLLQQMRSY